MIHDAHEFDLKTNTKIYCLCSWQCLPSVAVYVCYSVKAHVQTLRLPDSIQLLHLVDTITVSCHHCLASMGSKWSTWPILRKKCCRCQCVRACACVTIWQLVSTVAQLANHLASCWPLPGTDYFVKVWSPHGEWKCQVIEVNTQCWSLDYKASLSWTFDVTKQQV